jgi:hypothetical protein
MDVARGETGCVDAEDGSLPEELDATGDGAGDEMTVKERTAQAEAGGAREIGEDLVFGWGVRMRGFLCE